MKRFWRLALLMTAVAGLFASWNRLFGEPKQSPPALEAAAYKNKLVVPPMLRDRDPRPGVADYRLTVVKSKKRFFGGKSTPTYGYNGNYLGPTIRARKGDRVRITVTNKLEEKTTVHWHGLEVPARMDGGPHQAIDPESTWTASFRVKQDAATFWYHPHPHGATAEQVYKGLAGVFMVDDETSLKSSLPKDYGRDDYPLVIQDRKFARDGSFEYKESATYSRNGMFGDVVLVNGVINPALRVGRGKIRLRLVNGSNTRVYKLALSDNGYFAVIASDSGLLEEPVWLKHLELAPGERAEVIVDFSGYAAGSTVFLTDPQFGLIKFEVDERAPAFKGQIPGRLTQIKRPAENPAGRRRVFVMRSAGGEDSRRDLTINGRPFDMGRIDETVKLGDTEVWEIKNPADYEYFADHPLHIHGVRFQILSRNGQAPATIESGWKDTVLLHADETVKLIMRFSAGRGVYVYHCHMLEHEDAGMMGQYRVE